MARPLAKSLRERGYDVWFDEFELDVGDSLREAIDQGLAASRFGVVVLSERFFEKNWTKRELDGLVAREVVGDDRVILPVWHGIDEQFLIEVSPPLADRVAVRSAVGIEEMVNRIVRAMDRLPNRAASETAQRNEGAMRATPRTLLGKPDPVEMLEDGTRVRTGYDEEERRVWMERGGRQYGPGWLTVVVGPHVLEDDLIDPTSVDALELRNLGLEGAWGGGDPLIEYNLRPGLHGFSAQVPEPPDPPAYAVQIYQDGLMEFGTTLDRTGNNPDGPYLIPTSGVAAYIHDFTLKFLQILRHVGYEGEAAAMAAFTGVRGHELGVDRGRDFWNMRPIHVSQILSRPLVGLVGEIEEETGRWVRRTMLRVFLAAGIQGGVYFIDENGNYTDR